MSTNQFKSIFGNVFSCRPKEVVVATTCSLGSSVLALQHSNLLCRTATQKRSLFFVKRCYWNVPSLQLMQSWGESESTDRLCCTLCIFWWWLSLDLSSNSCSWECATMQLSGMQFLFTRTIAMTLESRGAFSFEALHSQITLPQHWSGMNNGTSLARLLFGKVH